MKIDEGPRKGNPTASRDFRQVAVEFPNDHRRAGPDVDTFAGRHEFGDTRYREVTYQVIATTAFTEFFREEKEVAVPPTEDPTGSRPAVLVDDRGLEAGTVVVKDPAGAPFRQGHTGDYVVNEADGTITPVGHGIPGGSTLLVSYVAPQIHSESALRPQRIRSSARPAPPNVEYVLPTFAWERNGLESRRMGNSLRVYLRRPWWSSGDEEKLAVVLWAGSGNDPDPRLRPYVTMWGFDPVYTAPAPPNRPVIGSFPLRVAERSDLTLPDLPEVHVNAAIHDVHYDEQRDLWYSDIELDFGGSDRNRYWPFVRLALARYQEHSLTGLELSPVVLTDFAQVAPDRHVSVSPVPGEPNKWSVTVTGRGYTGVQAAAGPARMRVIVEQARPGVEDVDLRWQEIGTPTDLTPSIGSGNLVTWTGTVPVQGGAVAKRVVVEEVELHRTGLEPVVLGSPTPIHGRRVVFTDVIELNLA